LYTPSSHLTLTAVTCLLARSPIFTDKLKRVLNAAARVVSGTWKLDRCLTQLRHPELHWLDVPGHIHYPVLPWSDRPPPPPVSSKQVVPPCGLLHLGYILRMSPAVSVFALPAATSSSSTTTSRKFGRRAFFVVGPMTWKSLPDNLRDPTICNVIPRCITCSTIMNS